MTRPEARYITSALEGKGYRCRFEEYEGGVVIVLDPVQCSTNGREYKEVTLRSAAAMRNFIHARQ